MSVENKDSITPPTFQSGELIVPPTQHPSEKKIGLVAQGKLEHPPYQERPSSLTQAITLSEETSQIDQIATKTLCNNSHTPPTSGYVNEAC